jgi:hypothetical protein
MSRTSKQYQRLAVIEADLRSLLRAAMDETNRTGFCWAFDSPSTAPNLNSFFFRKPRLRELLQLVEEAEALRSQLGEANEGIVARYRYWAAHHFSTDENRL